MSLLEKAAPSMGLLCSAPTNSISAYEAAALIPTRPRLRNPRSPLARYRLDPAAVECSLDAFPDAVPTDSGRAGSFAHRFGFRRWRLGTRGVTFVGRSF